MISFTEQQRDTIVETVSMYQEKQLMICVEEMAELMQAISKIKRVDTADDEAMKCCTYQIIEEMADVYIMLEQMQYFFGINHRTIEQFINDKLIRQEQRNKKAQTRK